ncbi:MAG: hypothetical protein BMS9Abin05_1510 [Rhodothermia bacterium]|nr:MAG: hypothetical protein BMS9Abin05_1510 [Rhodothermia bacterium]
MFREKEDKPVDGWLTVFKSGTDYEADLVKDRLVDSGISAVILAHRDHAFHLTVGDLAVVRVLVAPEQYEDAMQILQATPLTDEELDSAALSANPRVEEGDQEPSNSGDLS